MQSDVIDAKISPSKTVPPDQSQMLAEVVFVNRETGELVLKCNQQSFQHSGTNGDNYRPIAAGWVCLGQITVRSWDGDRAKAEVTDPAILQQITRGNRVTWPLEGVGQ